MDKANFIHPEVANKGESAPGENLWKDFERAPQGKKERALEEVIEIKKHGHWLQEFIFAHQDSLDLGHALSDLLFVAEDQRKILEEEATDESIALAEILKEEIGWFNRNKYAVKLDSLKEVMRKLNSKEQELVSKI